MTPSAPLPHPAGASPSAPRPPVRTWSRRGLALAAVAASLTCGGADDTGPAGGTTIEGVAYWSGPVRGATVVAYQLVNGERTLEVGRATTGDDGTFLVEMGPTYEHVAIDVVAGSFVEASSADSVVALDGGTILQGVALDLIRGEHRTGVTISPWTHLALQLGYARLAAGKEATFGAAVGKALERLQNHAGFNAATTAVASLAAPASSPTEPVKYALSLGGLSKMAALIAAEQNATVQSINIVTLIKVLEKDARSAEALFDDNGAEFLYVGATCPLPDGCTDASPTCAALCAIDTNALRARLGSGIIAFLLTGQNGTTLDREDLGPWLETLRANVDPELFGADAIEEFDALAPTVTWVKPAAAATVAGLVDVEVTATDPSGIASLTVTAATVPPTPLTDSDPSPGRFVATLSTVGMAEGPLTLDATAIDTDDNPTTTPRSITINNVSGGTLSGVVFKGAVIGATVRVYHFDTGQRGALVGTGTTTAGGAFTNITIMDGVAGPLLVEAGFGGTYPEEAGSATVTLDVADRMRTVIPIYADGNALSNLVVSPLTSFAVTYFEYLQTSNQGGTTLPMRWTTARAAMEAHFGVANIYDLTPLAPSEMSTFSAPARYGMAMVGLSQVARTASTLGGGDGGTFGAAMHAMRVMKALETDLADGCWDGLLDGATRIAYGGTQYLTVTSTRRDLANAIVAYLTDLARNQTPYAGATDVLSQLDALATGGGNMSPGSCTATSHLDPDNDRPFDQAPPTIDITTSPTLTDPPHVRGTFTLSAMADDHMIDERPTLRFTAPVGVVDIDGDPTDPDANATIDTLALVGAEGPLTISLESEDDSGNIGTRSVTYTVDNAPPVVTITGVAAGGTYRPPVTITYSAADSHLASLAGTLDGATFASGAAVTAEGSHTIVVSATDRAGNATTETRTFTVDGTAPTLTVTAPATNSYVRGPVTITFSTSDANPGASVAATLDGAAITSPHTFNVEGAHTLVVNATDAAGNTAATVSRTFTIDNTPPVLTVGGASDGGWYHGPITLTFSATDNFPPATITATLDGTAILSPFSLNTEGSHTLVVNAVDRAGNAAPTATRTFTVDNTVPTLALSSATPSGTVVRQLLTLTVVADDNLKALGSFGTDVAVTATGPAGAVTPTTVTASTLGDGKRQVIATFATATLPDGVLTVRFNIADRAGNAASQLTVARTMDNTDPVLIWATGADPNQMVHVAATWWVKSGALTITGTASDTNLARVAVNVGGTERASVNTTGGGWTLSVPAGLISSGAATDVTVTAYDLAGNALNESRATQLDVVAPAATTPLTSIRDEAGDTIEYATAATSGGFPTMNVRHTHAGATTTLGAATSCASPPSVTKYAYLLDQSTPPFVSDLAPNPLAFGLTAIDAGVGYDPSGVSYRVRNVTDNVTLLDWASPAGASPYTIGIFRNGAPSIAALGTIAGKVLAIDLRVRDRLANEVIETRCWNHRALPVPLAVGPFNSNGTYYTMAQCGLTGGLLCDATHGPSGSNKYALKLLSFADTTSPYDAIGALVLSDNAPGTGLMEFPVFNPTTETAYLTIDFTKPTATYSTSIVDARWHKLVTSTSSVDCGNADFPNATCDPPQFGASNAPASTMNATTSPAYGARIWETTGGTYTELAPCGGACNQVAPDNSTVRLTVTLPPRLNQADAPARSFVVMPVVKTITDLRPGGASPYIEFTVGGVTLTGNRILTSTGCTKTHYVSQTNHLWCDERSTMTHYRAVGGAAATNITYGTTGARPTASLKSSLTGGAGPGDEPATMPHMASATSDRRLPAAFSWTTAEQALPAASNVPP